MINKILFRPQRGSLHESIKEMKTFEKECDFFEYIRDVLLKKIDINYHDNCIYKIKISLYFDYPDKRIVGWDKTYIVIIEGLGPIGFINTFVEEQK